MRPQSIGMNKMDNFTLQPIPYLFFDGQCTEALTFYAEVLGGKLASRMTYGQMPGDAPCPEEAKDRVMNALVEMPGGGKLYGSDSYPGRQQAPMSGLMLALNFPTVDQAEIVFNALSVGGEVTMPFTPTFWAEKFGMLTDKFGVEWAINGNLQVPPQ